MADNTLSSVKEGIFWGYSPLVKSDINITTSLVFRDIYICSVYTDGMPCTMLQLLTSVLVFIAALHVVHAECTPKKHKTSDQLRLACEREDATVIEDANWFKDGVLLSNSADPSTRPSITVDGQGRVTISPVPKNEGIYSCNSSIETPVKPECFSVQGILA